MDDVITFVHNLFDVEYTILVKKYTEPDEQRFQATIPDLQRFFTYDIRNDFLRVDTNDPSFVEKGKRTVERMLFPRILFQIKHYQHPDYPAFYRIYTSNSLRSKSSPKRYTTNFYIAASAEGFKVVSRYDVQMIPKGLSLITTGGITWLWIAGAKISTLGDLVDVRKFEPPDDPAHRAEYEAE